MKNKSGITVRAEVGQKKKAVVRCGIKLKRSVYEVKEEWMTVSIVMMAEEW